MELKKNEDGVIKNTINDLYPIFQCENQQRINHLIQNKKLEELSLNLNGTNFGLINQSTQKTFLLQNLNKNIENLKENVDGN